MTSQKFYHETFILEQNSRNHKSILPQNLEVYDITDDSLLLKVVLMHALYIR